MIISKLILIEIEIRILCMESLYYIN